MLIQHYVLFFFLPILDKKLYVFIYLVFISTLHITIFIWSCQRFLYLILSLPSPAQAFFVIFYCAAEKTNSPLRDNWSFILSFSELSSVSFLNWLWITEVSLQVSVVADGEDYLSASALRVCLHMCYMIWVKTPQSPWPRDIICGTRSAFSCI